MCERVDGNETSRPIFKKLPGDKIIVAKSRRSRRYCSVMSACAQKVCEFR